MLNITVDNQITIVTLNYSYGKKPFNGDNKNEDNQTSDMENKMSSMDWLKDLNYTTV